MIVRVLNVSMIRSLTIIMVTMTTILKTHHPSRRKLRRLLFVPQINQTSNPVKPVLCTQQSLCRNSLQLSIQTSRRPGMTSVLLARSRTLKYSHYLNSSVIHKLLMISFVEKLTKYAIKSTNSNVPLIVPEQNLSFTMVLDQNGFPLVARIYQTSSAHTVGIGLYALGENVEYIENTLIIFSSVKTGHTLRTNLEFVLCLFPLFPRDTFEKHFKFVPHMPWEYI